MFDCTSVDEVTSGMNRYDGIYGLQHAAMYLRASSLERCEPGKR